MLKTGIADTYRYEQFIKKPDSFYNFEYLLTMSNLNSLDKRQAKEKLIFLEFVLLVKLYTFYSEWTKNLKIK